MDRNQDIGRAVGKLGQRKSDPRAIRGNEADMLDTLTPPEITDAPPKASRGGERKENSRRGKAETSRQATEPTSESRSPAEPLSPNEAPAVPPEPGSRLAREEDPLDLADVEAMPPLAEHEAIASMISYAPTPEDDETMYNYRDQYEETCKSTPGCAEKLVDEYLKYGRRG